MQLDLFSAPARPLIILPVDKDGPVIRDRDQIDEILTLQYPQRPRGCAWAEIELHRHTDGLWMWAKNCSDNVGNGGGYRVGPKWGKFAETREDALAAAKDELRRAVASHQNTYGNAVRRWLEGLR